MSDLTWKDAYGDAEGLACALETAARTEAFDGYDADAGNLEAAAAALREQAEEIERLRADLQGAEQRVLREFAEWCDKHKLVR